MHDKLCPHYKNATETIIHALRDCDHAQAILRIGGIDGRILSAEWETGIDWLKSSMRLVDKQAFECLITVLWNSWNARNNLLFRGVLDDPKVVWERDVNFNDEFHLHNLYNEPMIP